MKINKYSIIIVFVLLFVFGLYGPNIMSAATSPTLVDSANYSVLGSSTVTNTGATTTVGEVGVAVPGTAITGFPPGIAGGNNAIHLHSNDASAIAAQADNLTAFGALDAGANASGNCLDPLTGLPGTAVSGTDLSGLTLVPGLYCSAGTFLLTDGVVGDDLVLTGAGPWVFKTVSALNVSSGASVSVPVPGVDECEVWWRVGSSATLGTNSSFVGSILALTDIDLLTGATLVGRAMAQTAAVDLDTNTITGCAVPLVAASLTLDKIEVGDATDESYWTLTATGPTVLSGPGAAGSTDVVGNVVAGTYNLSESDGPSNYDSSPWSCVVNGGAPAIGASVVLTWGDTAVCTVTNTYDAPSSSGGSRRSSPPTLATLHVIKQVINDSGGIATASSFNLHVKKLGVDVLGSPTAGVVAPGTSYSLSPSTYVVSEDANVFYEKSFSGDCDSNGNVTLSAGDNKTCTIINNDVPKLPKTGFPAEEKGFSFLIALFVGFSAFSIFSYFAQKKQTN